MQPHKQHTLCLIMPDHAEKSTSRFVPVMKKASPTTCVSLFSSGLFVKGASSTTPSSYYCDTSQPNLSEVYNQCFSSCVKPCNQCVSLFPSGLFVKGASSTTPSSKYYCDTSKPNLSEVYNQCFSCVKPCNQFYVLQWVHTSCYQVKNTSILLLFHTNNVTILLYY